MMQGLMERLGISSRMTVVVLAAIVVAVLANSMFTSGQQRQRAETAETLETAQAQLAQVQARVTAVREGASDSILAKYLKGRTLGMLLPDVEGNRQFEATLPQLLARNGLSTDGISRGTPSTSNPQLQYLQYSLRVNGSFTSLRQFLRDLRAYPQLTSLTVSSLALPADSQQVTAQLSIRLYYSDQPPLEPLDDEPFPPYDYLSPLGQDVVDPDTSLAPPPTPTADEPTDDPSAEPDEVETVGPSPAPGP